MKSKSIRKRLTLSVGILSLVICLIFSIVVLSLLKITSEENMDRTVTTAANAYSVAVSNKINEYLSVITTLGRDSRIDPNATVDELAKVSKLLMSGTQFGEVSFANAKGTPYDIETVNLSERDYFKSAINRVAYISSPLVNQKDNTTVLYVAAKIENGKHNGIIFGKLPNDEFSKIIQNVEIGEKGYGFIINKEGTIVAHKDNSRVESFTNYITLSQEDASYKEYANAISKMLNEKMGTLELRVEGAKKYVAFKPIENTDGWILAMVADKGEMLSSYYSGQIILLIVSVIFLAAALAFSFQYSKSIGNPISLISQRLELLSKGDLTSDVPSVKTRDELYTLSNSLSETVDALNGYIGDIDNVLSNISNGNLMIETNHEYSGDFVGIKAAMDKIILSLRNTLLSINAAAEQVEATSQMVSNSSQSLSQGATEQASSVEELTASIAAISTQTLLNEENAKKASVIANTAKKNASEGNEQMGEMLLAMNEINESSKKINRIIKVIDDIAFQTNILALNAAVEAARAGEAGKGFTVVASEVKNLANRAAAAAKETTEMIESSIDKVESGTKIANQTAKTLTKIINDTEKVSVIVDAIAEASHEQAAGIEHINQGIHQVSQVVQANAATSEESAAASEELSSQATQLKQLINEFNLGRETSFVMEQLKEIESKEPNKKINLDGFDKY